MEGREEQDISPVEEKCPVMKNEISWRAQLMLQSRSLFGSYFSKLILLFSVYIRCFTATAKIIREVMDIMRHYNSIRNVAD
jgi:hypothetical protein